MTKSPPPKGFLKAYTTTRTFHKSGISRENCPNVKTIETFLTHTTYADISEIACTPVPFSVSYAKKRQIFPQGFFTEM